MRNSIETVKPPAFAVQSTYRSLFFDIERLIPSQFNSLDRDYLLERYAHEGDKFIFTALPLLGKAVERALIREEPLQVPCGFSLKRGTRLPIFLYHLMIRVFKENGDPILPKGDPRALTFIRQITLMYSKVEGQVDTSLADKAVESFMTRTTRPITISNMPELILARELLERVFDRNNPLTLPLRQFRKKPWGRHGPGAVADHSSPSQKWDMTLWPGFTRELFRVNPRHSLRYAEKGSRPVSRVTVVPKDFKGPRIICIEPKEFQFAQQGLMKLLYDLLTRHPLTRTAINFEDTNPSRRLCFRLDVGTIDLKDASDNLSLVLARLVLPRWLFKLVTRYRVTNVRYNKLTWRPNCLATMGNAFCFPLQTVIFWAIAQATAVRSRWINGTPTRPLRVFGDDIIVPLQASSRLLEVLTGCGLVVNDAKTCTKTLVKESCGMWVYAGVEIPLIRVKTTNVSNHRSWTQYSDYSVAARKQGLLALAESWECLRNRFYDPSSIKTRWNRDYQRLEYYVPTFATVGQRAMIDGVASLYAKLVHNDVAPFLHGTLIKVKRRWSCYPITTAIECGGEVPQ